MKRTFSLFGGILASALLLAWLFLPGAAQAKPTTAAQAQRVVQNWLALAPKHLDTELNQRIQGVETFRDQAGKPLYYVVHLDPAGLVLVPGDDLVEPIIGFLPEAEEYDPSADNPLGALVSQDIPGRVNGLRQSQAAAQAKGQGFAATAPMQQAQKKWDLLNKATPPPISAFGATYLSDVRVAPLVQSKWAQDYVGSNYCYNYYTPNHYYCGCTATAMAQVMRYHQHPTAGVGTGSFAIKVDGVQQTASLRGGDGSGGPYNWALMPLIPDDLTPLSQLQQIGALVYDAGVAVNMEYTASGSGAAIDNGHALQNVFNYGNAVDGWSGNNPIPWNNLFAMILPNLDAGLPVLLGITGSPGPHAILTDGYGKDLGTSYSHLNMGWAGLADAWYSLGYIDSNSYGGPGPFSVIYDCVYNIYPYGTGEIISGRVLDGSGQPLAGASVSANGGPPVTTNAKGIYAFTHLASGTSYTLSVTKPGYTFNPLTFSTGTSTYGTTTVGNVWVADFLPTGGTVKWGYYTNGSAYSPPALSPDGATAYMGSTDGKLYAINTADGSLKWSYSTGLFASSPAIAPDGTIYVGGTGGLYALNPDHSLKWKYLIPYGTTSHSPAIGPDGTIYVGSGRGFHAINPNNTLKWEWKTPNPEFPNNDYSWANSDPAIAADGNTVYVGLATADSSTTQYFIRAFNAANGTTSWNCGLANPIGFAPAIGWDGTIYVGVENTIYALDPASGNSIHQFSTGDWVGSPAIGADGTVYVGSGDNHLYALTADLTQKKWQYNAGGKIGGYGEGAPAIGNDGTIYISAWNGVHAVNADGTQRWLDSSCWTDSSPAIGPDGTVYVGVGWSLIAFKSTSTGLANSPWPMFHHDVRHTAFLSGTPPPPPDPPVANFSASPGSGYAPLTVLFQDTSTGLVTNRSWDFGDGTGGAFPTKSPSPSHTYKDPGYYNVTLTVSGPGGSSQWSQAINVTAPPLPAANFSASPSSGPAPLTVQFTDTSTGYVTGRYWDFGDGAGMPVRSPSHTYTVPGTYTVTLYVSNYTGTSSKTGTITVSGAPVADFTADPTQGMAPLTVQFTDLSTGDISTWSWNFGDGTTPSGEKNPSHVYKKPGTYNVTLTVSGPAGSSNKSMTLDVYKKGPPKANFTVSAKSGKAPLTVDFTDASSGWITGWSWTFGDGGTSTEQSPSHTYTAAGKWKATLTVTGPGGSKSKSATIKVTP